MRERIAIVKTGWSEMYAGGRVVGRHSHINEHGEAYEKFNFLPGPENIYYGYIPPIGKGGKGKKKRSPQPGIKENWLVIFVAAKDGTGRLTVVGWYENANFETGHFPRPEYNSENDFETDIAGEKFKYCMTTRKARLIPADQRDETVSGDHIKRTPIVYLRGNGQDEHWREELAIKVEQIVDSYNPHDLIFSPMHSFPTQEHIKEVDKVAIKEAISYLESKKYKISDRQKNNCGYDLLAKRKKSPDPELHIEVKGTSSEKMQFFISRNEWNYMTHPRWRLLIVTSALNNPKVKLLSKKKVDKLFKFNAIRWDVKLRDIE